ncbi:MAG: type II secretion system F family protein [Myxococcales bacterium]|nr:type II secretion system F family protein [Myxococcales bacterium]
MPSWVLVVVLSIVFTAVLATGQGLYWAWVAKKEREQEELLRRLGSGGGLTEDEREIALFREQAVDSVAVSMGNVGEALQTMLRKADVNYGVSTMVTRIIILAGVGAVVGFAMLGVPGLIIGIPLAYLPVFIVQQQGESRVRRLVEQLPDSLELMARALSAGLGLSDAFRLVAEEMPMPIAAEFGRVQEEVRFGRDYREAFDKMLSRNPGVFDLRIFVSSIMLQRDTGGNLIEILENISDTIRARFLFDAKVAAMTAEAKFSAMILGSLPLCVLALLFFSNPEYLEPMWTTWQGRGLIAFCIAMYAFGILLMRDLANVEV